MQVLKATAILGGCVLLCAWAGTDTAASPAAADSAEPDALPRSPAAVNELEFRIQPTANLATRTQIGNTLVLSNMPFSPADGLPAGEPYAVIGPAAPVAGEADVAAYAEQRITGISSISGLTGLSGKRIELNGREAWELTARGHDAVTGTRQHIYQLVVIDGSIPYVVLAVAGDERYPDVAGQFQAIARSLEIDASEVFGSRIQAGRVER